jgi:hypothetical protein
MQGDLVDPFEHAYDDDEHGEEELEDNHVRWLYEDKGRIFELVLGPDGESLVSNYVKLAEHVGANMADPYGRAMQWSKFPFEFDKAQVDLNTCDVGASRWDAGIHVDIGRCRELGMSQRFVDALDNGVDLLLDKVPLFDITRDNYKSALEELEATTRMVEEQAATGVVQLPFDEVKVVNSLGVVTKKLEPGQTGKPKLRVVVDAAASGVNECIRDMPFPMPGISDVVRSSFLGWWAAKFDLKDGFYHIPVNAKLVPLLGVKHPSSGQFGAYRFLCFGLKCAPFFFQGTMVELRRMLLNNGLLHDCSVLVYIDDWIIMGASEQLVRSNMEAFDKAMSELGFRLHPTKRDGPAQAMEYIGFLLNLAWARLSITGDKRDKIKAFVNELMPQVEAGLWDVSLADTTIGKLSAIAPVVAGGRLALYPFYQARLLAAAKWPNPIGKAPVGAKAKARGSNPTIPKDLWLACVNGLKHWKEQLDRDDPPACELFIFQDKSLAIWGPDLFPKGLPFALPIAAHGLSVICFVSDASSCGYAFYEGVPWLHPGRGKIVVGLWDPEKSTWTSNMRESLTVLYAASSLGKGRADGGRSFVVFVSDNTCAVAMANKLYSRSKAIQRVAADLKVALGTARAQSAAVHLPGKLNVFTDRPSRAGEAMYAEACISPHLISWVQGRTELMGERKLVCVPTPCECGHFVFLSIPKPHTREAEIAEAIAASKQCPGSRWALVLPQAAYGDKRWSGLFSELSLVSNIPGDLDIYARDVVRTSDEWANNLVLSRRPPGQWQLWFCESVRAGAPGRERRLCKRGRGKSPPHRLAAGAKACARSTSQSGSTKRAKR